ncbi:MAG: DNA polymerase III subunit delta' [Verrucomicrobiota bacterium]
MSFAEFPQQKQVVELLQRSLERGRLSHAYLFSGSDLSGLEAVARTLAKTLNCERPGGTGRETVRSDSCDRCLSCRKIDAGNHPDVQWVRPESKSRIITIDQMRSLMQTISLKPTEAPWKVAVIVAADRLNVQAANAFLKTLEEPPPQSVILLLSTEPARILETILSRCLRLSFAGESGPQAEAANVGWLTQFAAMASSREHGLLGRYCLLGSLLARLGQVKADIEKTLTERSPLERYTDLEPRLREKWEDELAAAIEAEYRRCRGDLLLVLEWWLRDVWFQASAVSRQLFNFPNLADSAQAVASRITPADALANIETLEQTQRLLGSNVQEALALEVGLLKLKL